MTKLKIDNKNINEDESFLNNPNIAENFEGQDPKVNFYSNIFQNNDKIIDLINNQNNIDNYIDLINNTPHRDTYIKTVNTSNNFLYDNDKYSFGNFNINNNSSHNNNQAENFNINQINDVDINKEKNKICFNSENLSKHELSKLNVRYNNELNKLQTNFCSNQTNNKINRIKRFRIYGETGFLNFVENIFEILNSKDLAELGYKQLILSEIRKHSTIINKLHQKMSMSK